MNRLALKLQKLKLKCRASLPLFARTCGFIPVLHQLLILDELRKLDAGETQNLILCTPPGAAKSTYVSKVFPVWYMKRHPGHCVLGISHTNELARDFGREVRNLALRMPWFGLRLREDSKAAGRWHTSEGGQYYAAGIGGNITGRRGDLAIVDDPVKSREDADSEIKRKRNWRWWRNDLASRMKPHARRVVVGTRWHEDDLIGRLLQEEGQNWKLISLPMLAEDNDPLGRAVGDRLWPEYFTEEMVTEAQSDPETWLSLYQQRPCAPGGSFFKKEWIRFADSLPKLEHMAIYGASDYATKDGAGDFTVHMIFGVDPNEDIWVLDLWKGQTDSSVWVEKFCDLVEKYRPAEWAEEQGQIRSAVGPFLVKRCQERKAYTYRRKLPSTMNKQARARSIQGRMAMRGINVLKSAAWVSDFVAELISFPYGKHDDIVDALSKFGQLLESMHGGEVKKPVKALPPEGSIGRKFVEERMRNNREYEERTL